jgi:copper(I)-binding protein
MIVLRSAALAAALICAPVALLAGNLPVLAEKNGILIEDGYARATGAAAKTGAAFMAITNNNDAPDRLIGAESGAAKRIELHTHIMTDGVAKMRHLEDGIPLPPGETVLLQRGGLHVMFMGLNGPFATDTQVAATLVFENAGKIDVAIPVDLERMPDHAKGHGGQAATN